MRGRAANRCHPASRQPHTTAELPFPGDRGEGLGQGPRLGLSRVQSCCLTEDRLDEEHERQLRGHGIAWEAHHGNVFVEGGGLRASGLHCEGIDVCPEGLQELPHNFVAACRDASAGEHDLGSRRVRGVQGAREGGRVVDDTMLIGQEGTGGAGAVIEAFGHFLIGGNFAVGLIVFAILVVINFVVITKGAERIAEVSARFTLDAMPGKQMAVDADLNAGLIDEKEAKRRRAEVAEEADFFGSMDGASKFVRGDAVAGILILNPDNPTGAVYPADVMRAIVEICEKNELFIISS